MSDIDPRAWLYPRLEALVADAAEAGIAKDVTVAMVTDIINAAPFNVGPPAADENWNKDVGEPDTMVNQDLGGGTAPLGDGLVGIGLMDPGGGRGGGHGRGRL